MAIKKIKVITSRANIMCGVDGDGNKVLAGNNDELDIPKQLMESDAKQLIRLGMAVPLKEEAETATREARGKAVKPKAKKK